MGILSNFRLSFNNIFFTPVLYGVVASLAVFLSTWDKGDRLKDKFHDKFRNKEDTFDFIIVGAGSAGAVLAYRLSEYYSVLLLEAGGEPHPFQAIPGLSLFLKNYPEIDWAHKTIRQKRACFACVKGQATISQGKNLGGTGNLNFLSYLRGHPNDFDHWAKITGDPSWSYQGVLPFFKISENFVGGSTDEDSHGKLGPLNIELPDAQGMAQQFIWAGQEFGYKNTDLNGFYDQGFDALYYPILKGGRQATYRAFIEPARKRKSLTIRKFAHVNKLLLRGNDNGAYGVEYDRHKKAEVAYATKEIILSAGAIQTPKILMLSGIGPHQHMNDIGIPTRVDLPVGQNLQDHLSTFVGPFFIEKPYSFLLDRDISAKSFLAWGADGTGVLTSSGITATGIISSTIAEERGEKHWPDFQLSLFGMGVHKTFASDIAHAFGFKEDILNKYYWHALEKESFQIIASNGRPVARGEIRLASRNPYDPVVIDPRYIDDPWNADIKLMIEAVKTAVALVENSTSFQNLGGHLTDVPFPGCDHHWYRTDAYWECYIRQYSVSLNHPTSTCAIGSVIDTELRVKGTKGLRVIDASSMPQITVSDTQAPVIMIAEKGAHMILEYWKAKGDAGDHEHAHYSGFANSHTEKPAEEEHPHDPFGNPFGIPAGEMPSFNNNNFGQPNTVFKNPFEGLVTALSQYSSAPTKNPFEEFFAGIFGSNNKAEVHDEVKIQEHGGVNNNEHPVENHHENIKHTEEYGDTLPVIHKEHNDNSNYHEHVEQNHGDFVNSNNNGYDQERNLRHQGTGIIDAQSSNYSVSNLGGDLKSFPDAPVIFDTAKVIDMTNQIPPTQYQNIPRKRVKINVRNRLNNIIHNEQPILYTTPSPHIVQQIPSTDTGTLPIVLNPVNGNNGLLLVKKPRRFRKKQRKLRPGTSLRANNIADIIGTAPPPVSSHTSSEGFLSEEAEVLNFQSKKIHIVDPGYIATHSNSGYFQPSKLMSVTREGEIRHIRRPSHSNPHNSVLVNSSPVQYFSNTKEHENLNNFEQSSSDFKPFNPFRRDSAVRGAYTQRAIPISFTRSYSYLNT